jgi:hypothetical protein
VLLEAAAREVSDVTGAGDTVIAVLAMGLAAGGTLEHAARLANVAAGLVVARFGPAAVTAGELSAALAALLPDAGSSCSHPRTLGVDGVLLHCSGGLVAGRFSAPTRSALYAGIAERLAQEPVRRWIAPEWWGFWPEAQMTGLFREHPAGRVSDVRGPHPSRRAGRTGRLRDWRRRGARVTAADGVAHQASHDARRSARRPRLLQLMPVAFIFRIRANHEYPILVCLLLALLGLAWIGERRAWWMGALAMAAD